MNEPTDNATQIGGGQVDPEQTVAESRRDFLKKAGKFAVYTPPVVMVLMKPSYATVGGSANGRPGTRPYPIPVRPKL
jgi:hypothetical protein